MLKPAEGQKVQIIKQLAPDGRTLNTIKVDHQADGAVACCQAMFECRLARNGVPASWGALIELLEDAEQSHLVEQIKNVLNL